MEARDEKMSLNKRKWEVLRRRGRLFLIRGSIF